MAVDDPLQRGFVRILGRRAVRRRNRRLRVERGRAAGEVRDLNDPVAMDHHQAIVEAQLGDAVRSDGLRFDGTPRAVCWEEAAVAQLQRDTDRAALLTALSK